MNQSDKDPKWWRPENDSAWNRAKIVLQRDWHQMKHSMSAYKSCKELEPACRFGYGARLYYGGEDADWDDNFETHLAEDWRSLNRRRRQKWEHDREAIRYGWNLGARSGGDCVEP